MQLRAVGSEGLKEAILHGQDAANIPRFVDGGELWLMNLKVEQSQIRCVARLDDCGRLAGPGNILMPISAFTSLGLRTGELILVNNARSYHPQVAFIARAVEADMPGEAEWLELPQGVPPGLLAPLPKRPQGPERLVILFDNSGSMAGEKLEQAKQALVTLFEEKLQIGRQGNSDEVGLIAFGPEVRLVFPPKKDYLRELPQLLHLEADNGTPMDEALQLLSAQFDDWVGANKRAIMITDGGAQIAKGTMQALAFRGIQVISIAIGTEESATLAALATATRGAVIKTQALWELDVYLAALA
jgi:hypothetical protein